MPETKSETRIKDDENFISYLLQADEISAVLKCHLRLELVIDSAIKKVFSNPENVLKWSFADKVEFLWATGVLSEKIAKGFKEFNSIRNKFSHEYSYKLTKENINFLESLGRGKKGEIPESLKSFPNIKEIALFVGATAFLAGWLDGRIDSMMKKGSPA